jgi:hypothetical protein
MHNVRAGQALVNTSRLASLNPTAKAAIFA